MHSRWVPLLLLLATAVPARALKDHEKQLMVELHNLYRAQVSPPASDMLRMRWDEELAAFAKAYAQKCVWGHNRERGRRGENLFAITDEGLDVPLAVEEWHQEREHYNLSAASCDPGQMCGHYTQVVWGRTERIGCGSHFCEKLQGVEETNIHLLVCNYEPPGNVKGQRPYRAGPPCSQCPPDHGCQNALCEPRGGPEADLPPLVTEPVPTLAPGTLGSRKTSTPSLATQSPRFLGPEPSGALATTFPPAVGTQASLSITTKGPTSPATEASPASGVPSTSVPSASEAPSPPPLDAGPGTVPRPSRVHASTTGAPPISPGKSLYVPTKEPLPRGPEEAEAEAEAELPPSREVLASVSPPQGRPGEQQAALDHPGHTSSKSLPHSPNALGSGNATGGRTLALQSSLSDKDQPPRSAGHVRLPFLGLLLAPSLLWAGTL